MDVCSDATSASAPTSWMMAFISSPILREFGRRKPATINRLKSVVSSTLPFAHRRRPFDTRLGMMVGAEAQPPAALRRQSWLALREFLRKIATNIGRI